MRPRFLGVFLVLCFALVAQSQKVPSGAILVKGAEPSASDSVTPVPEAGSVATNVYENRYFGLSYRLPADWTTGFDGPPPSDSGSYVLAQLEPADTFKGPDKGTILITAQDLFFAHSASSAMDLIKYTRDKLPSYYEVERPPAEVKIANRVFARFDYMSRAAGLHWYVLATEIRCHAVQFVFSSRDAGMLEKFIGDLNTMKLPGGQESPVCVRDYAATETNVVRQVDPILSDHKFNPIPVRIIIGTDGRVKHVHVISGFREQAAGITEAVMQWKFKPYVRNGKPAEVETGIMFGTDPRHRGSPSG